MAIRADFNTHGISYGRQQCLFGTTVRAGKQTWRAFGVYRFFHSELLLKCLVSGCNSYLLIDN